MSLKVNASDAILARSSVALRPCGKDFARLDCAMAKGAGVGSEPSTAAIRAEALRDFIARAFVAVGMPGADATTVAAYGKVKAKAQRGETMPEGWMIDREGRPLLDPTRADEGFLLPIGGYKGYGLALSLIHI